MADPAELAELDAWIRSMFRPGSPSEFAARVIAGARRRGAKIKLGSPTERAIRSAILAGIQEMIDG